MSTAEDTITRWRKKPVEVEAMQWTGDNAAAIAAFTGLPEGWPIVPHGWYAVKDGDDCFVIEPDAFAATYESPEPEPGLRSRLADADNAIGQVIRLAESWQMAGGHLDAVHVTRALLAICAPWTGMPVRELEAIGNGPLLDPDCRDGKCASCVGAPCEHECHKQPEAGRG
jgi:hypothetical protein